MEVEKAVFGVMRVMTITKLGLKWIVDLLSKHINTLQIYNDIIKLVFLLLMYVQPQALPYALQL